MDLVGAIHFPDGFKGAVNPLPIHPLVMCVGFCEILGGGEVLEVLEDRPVDYQVNVWIVEDMVAEKLEIRAGTPAQSL